ncbi:MAG: hypothetical protein H6523_13175 [Mycolicibacterium sp.]|nr:hypothetical protein [Mycolicibacterium sp.]
MDIVGTLLNAKLRPPLEGERVIAVVSEALRQAPVSGGVSAGEVGRSVTLAVAETNARIADEKLPPRQPRTAEHTQAFADAEEDETTGEPDQGQPQPATSLRTDP